MIVVKQRLVDFRFGSSEGAVAMRITRRGLKCIQADDTPDAKATDAGEDTFAFDAVINFDQPPGV